MQCSGDSSSTFMGKHAIGHTQCNVHIRLCDSVAKQVVNHSWQTSRQYLLKNVCAHMPSWAAYQVTQMSPLCVKLFGTSQTLIMDDDAAPNVSSVCAWQCCAYCYYCISYFSRNGETASTYGTGKQFLLQSLVANRLLSWREIKNTVKCFIFANWRFCKIKEWCKNFCLLAILHKNAIFIESSSH